MENSQERNQQKYPGFPRWIVYILVVSLLLNVAMYFRLNALMQEVKNLHQYVSQIQSSVHNAASGQMNQIQELLKREASLISEFSYEIGEYKDKRVDVLLVVKPKEYTKGEKVYFAVSSNGGADAGNKGKPELIEAQSTDQVSFTAKKNFSIFDHIEIDLVIDDGTKRKTEKLSGIYNLAQRFTAAIRAHAMGGIMSYDNKKNALMLSNNEFELLDFNRESGVAYTLRDVQLEIVVNEEIMDIIPMEKEREIIERTRYYVQLKDYSISCKTGDEIVVQITAKDDRGFTYRQVAQAWSIRNDGSIVVNEMKSISEEVEVK